MSDRLWARLMQLAEIGALPGGGVDRQALTAGEIEAWRVVIGWGREAGLVLSMDAAGNLFLTLPGRDRAAAPVLVGSHLDTQPTGGKFDGAFGVLAGLEVAAGLAEHGVVPGRDLVVVAWMNEEGCRFAPGMMGSEVFAGVRGLDAVRAVRDAAGVSVGEALDALHAAFPDVARGGPGVPAAYLEAHIEQGPVLERAGAVIGVVSGIQGKVTWRVTVEGAEGHAGTLERGERRDAVAAFARIAAGMHAAMDGADEAVRFTIGRVEVVPNAPSVIAGRVVFSVDLRHPDHGELQRLAGEVERVAAAEAGACAVAAVRLVDAPPTVFDAGLRQRTAAAGARFGARHILSAAGHDARHLATVCPAAMVFVPCRGGVSHAETEWAEPSHVAAGAAVLAEVVAGLLG